MDTRQNHRHQKHIHHDVDLYPPRPKHNHSVPPRPPPPCPSGVVLKRGTSPPPKPTGSQDNVFSPQSLSGSRRRFMPSVDLIININVYCLYHRTIIREVFNNSKGTFFPDSIVLPHFLFSRNFTLGSNKKYHC